MKFINWKRKRDCSKQHLRLLCDHNSERTITWLHRQLPITTTAIQRSRDNGRSGSMSRSALSANGCRRSGQLQTGNNDSVTSGKIDDTGQIQVGTHGIYIINGYNRGVLLPQVATEYGWDRETFLQQTCIKAGLPENSWQREDTEIFIFSGQIIHE